MIEWMWSVWWLDIVAGIDGLVDVVMSWGNRKRESLIFRELPQSCR